MNHLDSIFVDTLKRHLWRGGEGAYADNGQRHELPLRSELFGAAQLESHAMSMASSCEISDEAGPELLLHRLDENARCIGEAYRHVATSAAEGRAVASAAEWLLDNYYLIEEQIEVARDHLPPNYSRELPRLRNGPHRGLPRVYDLALELVSHTHGEVDVQILSNFVAAYQRVKTLRLGELWAVPIMSRLALLENLRRVSQRISARRAERDTALLWVGRFLKVVQQSPRLLITELADFVRSDPPLTNALMSELATHLQGQHAALGLVVNWLDHQLAEQGQTLEQILQAESQSQAADQITIGNSITSLRRLSANDWRTFVEEQSATEAILRRDPAGVYGVMDFASRDRYRHEVEHLARHSSASEESVAREAIRLAEQSASTQGTATKIAHIGFYLLDRGRAALEGRVGYRPPPGVRFRRGLNRHPMLSYMLVLMAVWAGMVALLVRVVAGLSKENIAPAASLVVVILLALSRPAISLVNWLFTQILPPRTLPRLDFQKRIPPECRTVVIVPTMLTSPEAISNLLDTLQLHYLANRDANLRLALLTDFLDADKQHVPGDEELVRLAADGITALNRTHGDPSVGGDLFFLFHRPRLWNQGERKWMGQERKRGKLNDFNRCLVSGDHGAFDTIVGDVARLDGVRFVITLDTDTQLPPGSAWRLVGTMEHPLNRPVLNPLNHKVVEGYGVLQPRVAVNLEAATRSPYARLHAGEIGVDPYTREVSNIYHDLFGRSQFIGKGIYDLRAFDAAVGARFPENTILSHDLIEGCYARCGFVDDVELLEDHPSRFVSDVSRRQRWIRGDWQILPWLGNRVPGGDGKSTRNPLGLFERWLIFDNLRRSMVPVMLLAALTGGWLAMLKSPTGYTAALFLLWFLPDICRALWASTHKPPRLPWRPHLIHVGRNELRQFVVSLLELAFLPYVAVENLRSILKVFWRRLFSGRKLLEWRTAHDSELVAGHHLLQVFWEMRWNVLIAFGTLVGLTVAAPESEVAAIPFFGVWLLAPFLTWFLSRTIRIREPRFTPAQQSLLHRLARRTWAYYDQFVDASHNWLPPDNLQEVPTPHVADRTSPTNIGLSLLSTLAAVDFGFLHGGQAVERISRTFATMEKLERYRGHFFNWYSTRTGDPFHPRYISSVDSGNLTGHLLTLRGGLEELRMQPIIPSRWRDGLQITASLVIEEMLRGHATLPGELAEAQDLLGAMSKRLAAVPGRLSTIAAAIEDCGATAAKVALLIPPDTEGAYWIAALGRQCSEFLAELQHLAPWLPGNSVPDAHAPARSHPAWLDKLDAVPTLATLAAMTRRDWHSGPPGQDGVADEPSAALQQAMEDAASHAADRLKTIDELVQSADELADADLDLLYDRQRKILLIGYHIDTHALDSGGYDLLASEARLASFVGVAQGKLPSEHWFLLGRQTAPGAGPLSLVSWSGSMFEYLMPLLVMPTYQDTLLDRAMRGAILRQIRYGRRKGVPWGFSESCYNQVDRNRTYQYRAFGVPELGLKRGLEDDLVVAPYAAAMALMLYPEAAVANLEQMLELGFCGRYGLYEAVDYTPNRLPDGQDHVIVRTFMAHHSGMTLLSQAYVLLGKPMQARLLRDPHIRASTLLLQERLPVTAPAEHRILRIPEKVESTEDAARQSGNLRVFTQEDVHNPLPDVLLLSNGRYSVMVNSAGSGFSRWQDLAVTRWREDAARDAWGTFIYLQDVQNGRNWSATFQPMQRKYDRYEATFSQARAEFHCSYHQIESRVEITVSPEDDIELRRITLFNRSGRTRTLEITSYGECVILDQRAEISHPVFNSLFVQTEILGPDRAILGTRRARSSQENPPWLFHMLRQRGESPSEEFSFETDRLRFIGRNRSVSNPVALQNAGPLSNTCGAVLDPIFAVRRRVTIKPGATARFDLVTGMAATRAQALTMIDRYDDVRIADRVFDWAWTHNQVLLHHLNAGENMAELFAKLAASVIYPNPRFRAPPSILARNRKGQSALWSYGLSGDLPIVLVRIGDRSGLTLVRQAIQAHSYWRQKGLRSDLVIWTDAYVGYRQSLLEEIIGLVNSSTESKVLDQPAGIFVRSSDQVPDEDRILLQAVARVVLNDRAGTLQEQVERRGGLPRPLPPTRPTLRFEPIQAEQELPHRKLIYFNGLGGFTADGREYVITLRAGSHTPAPWANVMANAQFGTVVTEYGSAYSWFENAHECRLTPWYNDPVSDCSGEAFYLRDEETGHVWSPMPGPARGKTPYVCRHGIGYSVWEHLEQGIFSEAWVYVATDAPVKFCSIRLHNRTGRTRRISITGYCEWVLGEIRDKAAMHVVSSLDPQTGALFAVNAFNYDFPGRTGFFHCSEPDRSFTSDRMEFLGRHGSAASPDAMRRKHLSDKVGAGLDPCAAIQTIIELPPGQQREVVFILGAGNNENHARSIVRQFVGTHGARQALQAVWDMWNRLLGGLHVQTPDPSINFLMNHWLLYQVLACRFWGRSGYYQSGGAFGFRDQLQDAMAFLHECPWLLREQLLLAASRQFRAGDVQHWWHPPNGRGVRTHFSDDFLWLPLALCRYVAGTGDTGILDEPLPFLEARTLRPDEEASYDLPMATENRASLYEHCVRAIRHGLTTGPHGLPLIGGGDWNDGMNRVGAHGQGESVWLAFFQFHVLQEFIPLARSRADSAFADECTRHAEDLRVAIETHGWDGQWYRRAYFDDGTPLGSRTNPECQIDLLPQSWALLSGAAQRDRANTAMDSAVEQLVDKDLRLIRLLTPPFDKAPWDPGYIKGYVPGVRENGGQYTHAAIWLTMAAAAAGNVDRAWQLFSYINPVLHADSAAHAMVYRVEPYVVAADVYTLAGHAGQGGWTWYTGSASWMYRLILESLLGITLHVDRLRIKPLLPPDWKGFTIHYRFRETVYHIEIVVGSDPQRARRTIVDDREQLEEDIQLVDDRAEHHVRIEFGVQAGANGK